MNQPPPSAAELCGRLAACGTAAVSDAMDSLRIPALLVGIQARTEGAVTCGPAFTVAYRACQPGDTSFKNAANYIDAVPAGSVIVIDNAGRGDCTNWGSLLTHAALLRGVAGTVLHGSVRDIFDIRRTGYALFSTQVTMVTGKNRVELAGCELDLTIGGILVKPGDLILGDDNGVLRVPHTLAREVASRAERVAATEARIATGLNKGMGLTEARTLFGYATPWNAQEL